MVALLLVKGGSTTAVTKDGKNAEELATGEAVETFNKWKTMNIEDFIAAMGLKQYLGKLPEGKAINDRVVGGIDRLGYKYYAKALVKMLKTAQPPLCIGLYARWGAGKSFLIDLIKSEFDPEVVLREFKMVQKFELDNDSTKAKNDNGKVTIIVSCMIGWVLSLWLSITTEKPDIVIFNLIAFLMMDLWTSSAYLFCKAGRRFLSFLITVIKSVSKQEALSTDFINSESENNLSTSGNINNVVETFIAFIIGRVVSLWLSSTTKTVEIGDIAIFIITAMSVFFISTEFASHFFYSILEFIRIIFDINIDIINFYTSIIHNISLRLLEACGFDTELKTNAKTMKFTTEYIFVDFNAWEYCESDELWTGLIHNLYEKVELRMRREIHSSGPN